MSLPPLHNPPGLPLERRRAVCFGMGASGVASGLFLKAKGLDPLVVDEGPAEKLQGSLDKLQAAGVRALPGLRDYGQLGDPDLVIVSPGVPTNHPLLVQARQAGAQVIGEIELAYRFCAAPTAAITGTNGKGTTTRMLEGMLTAEGLRARAGGNIGEALVGLVEQDLQVVVAEVSSFQLETIELFHPWASILLNVTPDHMNRYAGMPEYTQAKLRLFVNQTAGDVVVLNTGDPTVARVADGLPLPVLKVNLHDPTAHGFLSDSDLMVRLPGEQAVRVCEWTDLYLQAEHYATDALCAAVVALSAGVGPDAIAAGARGWRPTGHQLQEVAVIGGVRFVDDSKATNPEAAMADLRTFPRPLLVIGGGDTKGRDMKAYADALAELADAAFLIGDGAEQIARALGDRLPVTMSGTLEQAVPAAYAAASAGATVILAPGCASFDQFNGQAERGDHFAGLVRQLA
ncbi:UDP-N-acetylmuramoyl-L-alanine--D-glutamate ligase [bacterium]|nr:UDP-N-acetylmuramoyl-L-alanine--D-glutamate ligase [bacterium]